MRSTPKMIPWMVAAGAFLLAVPLVLSQVGFFPWSPINCWHYEVDIHSGRIRYTRYLAFVPVSQRTDESAVSRVLHTEDFQYSYPDWRRAVTLSPGVRNSPHYIFHSAIAQIRELELLWHAGNFTPAARRSSAKRVIELWQEGQNDDAAKSYLRTISDLAFRSDSELRSTNENDLPTVH